MCPGWTAASIGRGYFARDGWKNLFEIPDIGEIPAPVSRVVGALEHLPRTIHDVLVELNEGRLVIRTETEESAASARAATYRSKLVAACHLLWVSYLYLRCSRR